MLGAGGVAEREGERRYGPEVRVVFIDQIPPAEVAAVVGTVGVGLRKETRP